MQASPPLKRYRDSNRKGDDDNNNPPTSRIAVTTGGEEADESSIEVADGIIETEEFPDGLIEEGKETGKGEKGKNSDNDVAAGECTFFYFYGGG